MKINFNKLNNKPVPLPIPWYKRMFRKAQLGLALGETRTKKQPSLFEQEHTVGETKTEGGRTYTLEEGTPGKPRWHRKDEEQKETKPDKTGDKLSDAINQKLKKEEKEPEKPVTEEEPKPVKTEDVQKEPEKEKPEPARDDTYLPEGWDESTPGGMATNKDPVRGGIVDNEIVSGKWFVVPENEAIGTLEGFATRKDAFDALEAELKKLDTPDDLEEELRHEPELTAEEQSELFDELTGEEELTDEPDKEPEKKTRREYTDVGEKIGGAKKDIWAEKLKMGELLRREDFDFDELEKYPELAGKVIKKENFIPKTAEFAEEMRNRGYDADAAFLHTKIAAAIAAKPADDPLSVQQYIVGLDMVDKYLFRAKTVNEVLQNLSILDDMYFGYNIPADAQQKIIENDEALEEPGEKYRELSKEYNHAAWYVEEMDKLRRKTKEEFKDEYREKYDNYKSRMEEIEPELERLREHISKIQRETNEIRKQYKENVDLPMSTQNVLRSLGKRFDNLLKWRYMQGSDAFKANVKEAMMMDKDDWGWVGKRKTAPRGRVVDRIPKWEREVPEEVERKGEQVQKEMFKPDDLLDSYGIRGVEYGNYVDEESAKYHTQMAGLAFHDLSRVLGIDNQKISYNGRLAMAFGARGSGKAKAHYEPGRMVINMTKFAGGGSLAHEWGHFIDNVVAIVGYDKKKGFNSYLSDGSIGEHLPDKIKNAVTELNNTIRRGDIGTKEVVKPTDRYKTHYHRQIDADVGKMTPQEVYDKHVKNLDNHEQRVKKGIEGSGYYSGERKLKEFERVENKTQKERKKIATYIASKTNTPITLKSGVGKSHFVAASTAQGSYWAKDVELFARAFESYVEDELTNRGMKNTYLVSGTQKSPRGYLTFDSEVGKYTYSPEKQSDDDIPYSVYPQGEERERINNAMRNFIEALKEEDLFEKAIRVMAQNLNDN